MGETAETVKRLRPFAYADDQGNFELKTYVNGDGAPLGKYQVCIVALSSGGPAKRGKDDPPGAVGSSPAITIPPEVTNKYRNIETSGLEVTIIDGENNLAPFTL